MLTETVMRSSDIGFVCRNNDVCTVRICLNYVAREHDNFIGTMPQ